jgi:hypothetical protein
LIKPFGDKIMARKPHIPKTRKPATQPIDNVASETVGKPVFAQPQRTDDPDRFSIKHPSDAKIYGSSGFLVGRFG